MIDACYNVDWDSDVPRVGAWGSEAVYYGIC